MGSTFDHMLALIVVVLPLPICGLVLNPAANPQPLHHIDFDKFDQNWSSDIRQYMEPSEEDLETYVPPAEDDLRSQYRNGQEPCTGDACDLHGKAGPKLFLALHRDGIGAKTQAITAGMALATKHGLSFGGVDCGKGVTPGQHSKYDVLSLMRALYGTDLCAKVPRHAKVFNHVKQLDAFCSTYNPGNCSSANMNMFLRDLNLQQSIDRDVKQGHATIADYFTPQFLNGIRQANTLPKHSGGPTKPVVALHVRRGDAKRYPFRLTSNAFYYDMVRAIQKRLPNADVHVFSEGSSKEFDGYSKRGMHLHLGSRSVSAAWEYFSSADVVITAKSSFSMVPAMFNPNCVIYQVMWHHPLDDWMIVDSSETTINDDELKACLKRIPVADDRASSVPQSSS